jgi:hypothetical protein
MLYLAAIIEEVAHLTSHHHHTITPPHHV